MANIKASSSSKSNDARPNKKAQGLAYTVGHVRTPKHRKSDTKSPLRRRANGPTTIDYEPKVKISDIHIKQENIRDLNETNHAATETLKSQIDHSENLNCNHTQITDNDVIKIKLVLSKEASDIKSEIDDESAKEQVTSNKEKEICGPPDGIRIPGQVWQPSVPDAVGLQFSFQQALNMSAFQPISDSSDQETQTPSAKRTPSKSLYRKLKDKTPFPGSSDDEPGQVSTPFKKTTEKDLCKNTKPTKCIKSEPGTNKTDIGSNLNSINTTPGNTKDNKVVNQVRAAVICKATPNTNKEEPATTPSTVHPTREEQLTQKVNSDVRHVLALTMEKWAQYLGQSDLHQAEVSNARMHGYNQDALKMVTASDTTVWGLVLDLLK